MLTEDEDIPVSLTPVRSTSADGSSKRMKAIAAAALGGGAGLSTMFMKDTLKRVDSFEEEVLPFSPIWLFYFILSKLVCIKFKWIFYVCKCAPDE